MRDCLKRIESQLNSRDDEIRRLKDWLFYIEQLVGELGTDYIENRGVYITTQCALALKGGHAPEFVEEDSQ